jgi:MFS transporter, DHA3 family, multidrug efflux protein
MSSTKLFFHILGNTILAGFANMFLWFALVFWAYLETRSVMITSLIGGVYMLLTLAWGIYFGSLVDHHRKKPVMGFSTLVSLGMYIGAFLLYISQSTDIWQEAENPLLWLFILLIMIGGVVGNIRMIALSTMVTLLFEEKNRDKANGLVGMSNGLLFTVVSALSGLAIGQLGMGWALALSIIAALLSLIHLIFLSFPQEPHELNKEKSEKKVDLKGTIAIISGISGLWAMIVFAMWNNFLGGVFMSLMDAYGLMLVSVEVWGIILALTCSGFIFGGMYVAKYGLGKNPVWTLLFVNIIMWAGCLIFIFPSSIILTGIIFFIYMFFHPIAEACEQTILQKVVPYERQGRVFGFSQSVEQCASPLTAFFIGPIAELFIIPFMASSTWILVFGSWFWTTEDRALALIFSLAGIIGLIATLMALASKYYRALSESYLKE